jgi:hypothetical protein
MSVRALSEEFGDPFGSAHDISRSDCLIRGDHNETFQVKFLGYFEKALCSFDIGEYGFARVKLHDGNMLIGCGVEDHIWSIS